jgi:GT2 family glycosyltransferase
MSVTQQKVSTKEIDDQFQDYVPVRILEIELGHELPTISAFDEGKVKHYQSAHCLVRLHSQPLGLVELKFEKDELFPDEYAPKIWQSLNIQINEHLQQDGLQTVTTLASSGLTISSKPLCIEEREQFLNKAPFVSVIVSTHDRPEQLVTCLNSFLSLDYPLFEVIVVDNAPSTDDTANLVQKLSQNGMFFQYVREDRPGLSWARNRGIMEAKGEILVFTDDDVVVDPYWLVGLVRGFSIDANVVCVSGLVLPLELDTPAQLLFEEYGGFNKGFTHRIFKPGSKIDYPDMPLYPYVPGRFGVGASMAFRADFLRQIGGFDPALGGSGRSRTGQDISMFLQVILEGYKIVYQPGALLYHLHRRDYAGLCKQIYYYGIGTTAFLTKVVLENPIRLFELIAKMPYGLFFILNSRSPKNKKRSKSYPKHLIKLEKRGMLYGPFAYMMSRSEISRNRKELALAGNHSNQSLMNDGSPSANHQPEQKDEVISNLSRNLNKGMR